MKTEKEYMLLNHIELLQGQLQIVADYYLENGIAKGGWYAGFKL